MWRSTWTSTLRPWASSFGTPAFAISRSKSRIKLSEKRDMSAPFGSEVHVVAGLDGSVALAIVDRDQLPVLTLEPRDRAAPHPKPDDELRACRAACVGQREHGGVPARDDLTRSWSVRSACAAPEARTPPTPNTKSETKFDRHRPRPTTQRCVAA
ncbi:MAG: hypothetical protein IT459_07295 [Planctomycetes bacterium]|nr:hypothetical protein [Planctomycetota bacterium]